jgi:hypothetical protein
MRPILRGKHCLRALLRHQSSSTKAGSAPSTTPPQQGSVGLYANKPPAGGPKAAAATPAAAPGPADTKQGLSLVSIVLPVAIAAGVGAGYYAYKEGYFGGDVVQAKPAPPVVAAPAKPVLPKEPPKSVVVPPVAAAQAAKMVSEAMPATVVASAPVAPTVALVAPSPTSAPAPVAAVVVATVQSEPIAMSADPKLLEAALAVAGSLVALERMDSQMAQVQKASEAAAAQVKDATAGQVASSSNDKWKSDQVATLLRREASDDTSTEVAGLTVQELRERVLQLSHDLSTRSKWEAVHLLEMLEKSDSRWQNTVSPATMCCSLVR